MTLPLLPHQSTHLLAPPVQDALKTLPQTLILGVTENSAELADTDKWAETYGIPLAQAANVVVLEWRKSRSAEREFAAVLVLATDRADINGAVKKQLGAYKVSFAPYEKATAATGMESGGMSPIGLPADWPLLIDSRVLSTEKLYIGSGIRPSKLVVNGAIFAEIPGAQIVPIVQAAA